MNLLIVRHGKAEDQSEFGRTGKADHLRPLTPEGKREMKTIAKAVSGLVNRPALLATSPYTRAVQTAEALSKAIGIKWTEIEELTPEKSPIQFAKWLTSKKRKRNDTVVIVGHEPHLSTLASWAISGPGRSFLELKKGGACFIEFSGTVKEGSGLLRWLATPNMLRNIGNS